FLDVSASTILAHKLDHAACLLIGRQGVLVRGQSGSGKSFLRRYMSAQCQQRGLFSALVSDDYVHLLAPKASPDFILAQAPKATFAKQEVRGVGICQIDKNEPCESLVRVHLVVDLQKPGEIVRYPEPQEQQIALLTASLPRLSVPRQDCVRAADMIFATLSTLHS
ncbi:MAG: hypothetical protein OIF58_10705, partial [Cohaesibacter sp.]|nr:hypothetical protein [Cohaesibacter sp.]